MTITNAKYQLVIDVEENQMPVLVLENAEIYSEFVEAFCRQCAGEEGEILLSEDHKPKQLSKCADVISDYFSLDFNSRAIQSHLYQQLRDVGNELVTEKERFIQQGVGLMEDLLEYSRFDHVVYNLDLEWNDIFKLFHVSIEEDYVNLQEKLISYLRLCAELLNKKLVIFVNLKAYLSEENLLELYQMAGYFKIQLLLIESVEGEALPPEKYFIIDRDQCLIVK